MENQATIIAKTIIINNTEAILSDQTSLIIENSLSILKDNHLIKYFIFNKNNADPIFIKNKKWSLITKIDKNIKVLETNNKEHTILNSNLENEDVFHYVYPIQVTSYNWGFVHIGFSLDEYYKNQNTIYKNFILISLTSFLVVAFFAFLLTKWLIKPILRLNITTKAIVEGNYKEIPNKASNDEIYELTDNFNLMLKYLKKKDEEVFRSYSVLEEKVKIRTKELKELNESLDLKVHEEVQRRQNQEKYIHEQSKMAQMGEMLNNIAHQWRQPLSVIATATSGIKLKKELDILEDDEFNNSYKIVMENVKYLTKTIDTFSKYTDDNYNIELVSLKDVISDLIIMHSDTLKKNFIKINFNVMDTNINIKTIPNLLSHVTYNILINANNALMKNKSLLEKIINIRLIKTDKSVIIEIEDNAGGIEDDIINNIFEPYFTTKFNSKGVGVGLYLSYDIVVNQLNGKITVDNGNLGAIFKIELPYFIDKT
jgi:signal transduction histidine kinase